MGVPVAGHGIPNIQDFQEKELVKRRNSGVIKSGLPLIITGGQKRHSDFQYRYTEPGKFKKPAAPGTQSLQMDKRKWTRKEFAEVLRFHLPRTFCPDQNHEAKPEGGALNPWIIQEPAPYLGLQPGHVVISYWCADCQRDYFAGQKLLAGTGIDNYSLQAARMERMERNIKEYIKQAWLTDIKKILPNQEMCNAYKG